MPKITSTFVCQSCGSVTPKWSGRCDACGGWNTIVEEAGAVAVPKGLGSGKGHKLALTGLDAHEAQQVRLSTGVSELDRVLGGGLVAGSAVLLGGDPGIGKSTLLLQVAAKVAGTPGGCVYVSGEESEAQISLRAARLGLSGAKVQLASASSVRDILATLDTPTPPGMAIIDSIQTMFVDNLDAAPGTVSQVRASAHELIRVAKRRGTVLVLVGHVTKEGTLAGPRVLEHMVDTVLYFEGERGHPFRVLRAVKNRFGGTDEIGVFEMTGEGLQEVTNPSALFLSERTQPVSGAAVFAGIEGTRPLLVEIQALVAPSTMAMPRRAVVGWDTGRLSMVLAVLEARCGVRLSDREVYLNVAGGLRVQEPAADLAVACAILSALSDVPVPQTAVVFGEIGLSGEIRKVARADLRLKEAEKLGFTQGIVPQGQGGGKLVVQEIAHLRELLPVFLPARGKRAAVESV